MVIVKDHSDFSLLTYCISTNAQNNKPVKIWTQLSAEFARKTPLAHEVVYFQMLDFAYQVSFYANNFFE